MSKLRVHALPTLQQLPLPLPELEPPPALPPEPPPLPPRQLWASLAPTTQAQVRQTILHIMLEVFNDHTRH